MTSGTTLVRQPSGTGGLSTSLGTGAALLRRWPWVWPIVAALGLTALGWYTHRAIEDALHQQMSGQLQTILGADVESLRIWIKEQELDAELIVAATPLRPAVLELLALTEGPDSALLQSNHQAALRASLQPRLKQCG